MSRRRDAVERDGRVGRRRALGRRAVLGVVGLLALLVAACSEPAGVAVLPPTPGDPVVRYVAVGASDSLGVGADQPLVQSWPQVLLRGSLPVPTVFVDVARDGATVADAIEEQLPLALEQQPDLVTVSFGVNDLRAGVAPDRFEADLGSLVRGLRRGGATRVLLANVPPLDHLPAYRAEAGRTFPPPDEVGAAVAAYDEAVARVAAAEGAEPVDLFAAGMAARADGSEASLVSADGFHPSTAGHARIAAAFAAVLG